MFNINDVKDKTHNGIGVIAYNIDHINPRFDYIKHTFFIKSNKHGYNMVESTFEMYLFGDVRPRIISDLTDIERISIWDIIFGIKKYHYDKYKPDIVYMVLKSKIFSQHRVNKYLDNMNYAECACVQDEISKDILYYGNFYKIDRVLRDNHYSNMYEGKRIIR